MEYGEERNKIHDLGGVKSSSNGLARRLAFGDGVTCRLSMGGVLVLALE